MNSKKVVDLQNQLDELEASSFNHFNASTVMMASRIVRIIRKQTGDNIRLSEKGMLANICSVVIRLDDKKLTAMCQHLFATLLGQETSTISSPSIEIDIKEHTNHNSPANTSS